MGIGEIDQHMFVRERRAKLLRPHGAGDGNDSLLQLPTGPGYGHVADRHRGDAGTEEVAPTQFQS